MGWSLHLQYTLISYSLIATKNTNVTVVRVGSVVIKDSVWLCSKKLIWTFIFFLRVPFLFQLRILFISSPDTPAHLPFSLCVQSALVTCTGLKPMTFCPFPHTFTSLCPPIQGLSASNNQPLLMIGFQEKW